MSDQDQPKNDFARQADEAAPGFFSDLFEFLRTSKKWWLTPIIIVMLAIGLLIVLGSTAIGPFIYALF